jgi:hypothetical protein
MAKKKSIEPTQYVEEWECYTFKESVAIWLDIYGLGERIKLTEEDLKVYWPYVVLTKDYKWPRNVRYSESKPCWCK